jgi:hypothetical protein
LSDHQGHVGNSKKANLGLGDARLLWPAGAPWIEPGSFVYRSNNAGSPAADGE